MRKSVNSLWPVIIASLICTSTCSKYREIENYGVYLNTDEGLIEVPILTSTYPGNFSGNPVEVKKFAEIIIYYEGVLPTDIEIKRLKPGEDVGEYWYVISSGVTTPTVPSDIKPIKKRNHMYSVKPKESLLPGYFCVLGPFHNAFGTSYDKGHCFSIPLPNIDEVIIMGEDGTGAPIKIATTDTPGVYYWYYPDIEFLAVVKAGGEEIQTYSTENMEPLIYFINENGAISAVDPYGTYKKDLPKGTVGEAQFSATIQHWSGK